MKFFDSIEVVKTALLIIILVVEKSESAIEQTNTYAPQLNKKATQYWSWTSAGSYAAVVKVSKAKLQCEVLAVSYTIYPYINVLLTEYSIDFNNSFSLRMNGSGTQFLVYNKSSIKKYMNSTSTSMGGTGQKYSAESGVSIVDVIYGVNNSQLWILTKSNSTPYYSLLQVVNEVKMKNISTHTNISCLHYKSIFNVSSIYVLFSCGIAVFAVSSTSVSPISNMGSISNITLVKYIQFADGAGRTSMWLQREYLAYAQGTVVRIVDTANSYLEIYNYTVGEPGVTSITEVAIKLPYMYILYNSQLVQVDIDIDEEIGRVSPINTTNATVASKLRMQLFLYNIIAVYSELGNDTVVYFYRFTHSYISNTSCYTGYGKIFGICFRDLTYRFPANRYYSAYPNPNTYPNNTTTINNTNNNINNNINNNTINNTINNVNMINTTSIGNSSSANNTSMSHQNNNSISSISYNDSSKPVRSFWYIQLQQTFGNVMAFASLPVTPNFLISFLLALDDMWWYQFHRVDYPASIDYFISNVNVINGFRIEPSFVNFMAFLDYNNVGIDRNNLSAYQISHNSRNPLQLYFLFSSQSVYKSSVLINVLLFFVLKALEILLFALGRRFSLCKYLHKEIKAYNKLWTLLTAIIETNISKIIFSSVLQFLIVGHNDFFDKFNIIFNCTLLYMWVAYCILFYPLVFRYEKRKSGQSLLTHSVYSLKAFCMQSSCLLFRNVVRNSIHAAAIQCYQYQILALVIVDYLFLFLTCRFCDCFINKAIFIFFIAYQFTISVIDTLFLINSRKILLAAATYDIIIFYLICAIMVLVALMSITILFTNIIYFSSKHFKCSQFRTVRTKRINEQLPNEKQAILSSANKSRTDFNIDIPAQFNFKERSNRKDLLEKYKRVQEKMQLPLDTKIKVFLNKRPQDKQKKMTSQNQSKLTEQKTIKVISKMKKTKTKCKHQQRNNTMKLNAPKMLVYLSSARFQNTQV